MDITKLNRNQLDIAEKIAVEAEKQGLNSKFVLSLAMAESGLNPNAVSPKGALGVMQLMPDTAKSLNVDPNDVDQNIRGGIKFLKRLVENKNIGNDPYKVLAGYNAGPGTKFVKTGKVEDLVDETVDYADRIMKIYGGDLPNPRLDESDSKKSESTVGIAVPSAGSAAFTRPSDTTTSSIFVPGVSDVMADVEPVETITQEDVYQTKKKAKQATRDVAPILGGVTGAATTAGAETGAKIYRALRPEAATATAQETRVGLQSWLNNMLSHQGKRVNFPLEKLEELYGKKINTLTELGEAYKTIAPTPTTRVPKTTSIDPKTGVARQVYRTVPGQPGIDIAPYQVSPARAAAQDVASSIGRGASAVFSPLSKIAVGTLGAATGALSAYDAAMLYKAMEDKYKAEGEIDLSDVARLGTKGMAALGGGFTMIPHPVSQGLGLALQAPETAWSLYDISKNRPTSPLDVLGQPMTPESVTPLMSDEEARKPAFRYPRISPRRNP